jgi:hypothetical protein
VNTDLGQFALGLAVAAGMAGFFFGPIGRAIAARIAGKKYTEPSGGLSTGEMTAERMAAMEERLVELEAERAQLEERLEFAERMLTSGEGRTSPLADSR